jgi:cell division protein FtsW
MLVLPVVGLDSKGATRWLNLGFLTLQPSEFMKPCFSIAIAWIFSEQKKMVGFPGYRIAFVLFALTSALLLIQPDVGMTLTLTVIFGVQLFLSGISILWVLALIGLGISALIGAYWLFPHVADRINGFLDPSTTDNYQVNKSLEAFSAGGLTGTGPGEGQVKWQLPDAHTDFIYAVIGEEYGMLVALITAGVFAAVVMRGMYRASQSPDMFIMLAVAGLVAQFGLQAFINMGVAVHLLPAKGMTLPFLSYGGSSLLAMAVTAGAILGLSRRRYGALHRAPQFGWRHS